MPIVIFLGKNVKEYANKNAEIIARTLNENAIRCELCLQPMRRHSSYERGIKETGERITITVVWCRACQKWHALLPDFLLRRKHYSGNEIESVIIDSATERVDRIETEASESAVRRWIKQIGERVRQAVSVLKYQFRRAGQPVSEIMVDAGSCYDELERILDLAPSDIKYSGNKLGLANIWLRTSGMAVYI